jgi:hypothetical protein
MTESVPLVAGVPFHLVDHRLLLLIHAAPRLFIEQTEGWGLHHPISLAVEYMIVVDLEQQEIAQIS